MAECSTAPQHTMWLPLQVDILCTHPMFGPDSGKGSWKGLKFMYERVRISSGERRQRRANIFLEVRNASLTIACTQNSSLTLIATQRPCCTP